MALLSFSVLSGVSCSLFRDVSVTGYVFSYGVDDYGILFQDGIGNSFVLNNLTYTDDDAYAVYNMFSSRGYNAYLRINDGGVYNGGGIYPDTVSLSAAKSQLETDIAWAAANAGSEDTVVFFFAGHGGPVNSAPGEEVKDPIWSSDGTRARNDWFFLYSPSNVDYADLEDNFLSDDTLGELLESIPKGKIVVIFDSCNSGGFIGDSIYYDPWNDPVYDSSGGAVINEPEINAYNPPSIGDLISSWANGLSGYDVKADVALVLAAAGEQEESLESSGTEHGIFTYFLLQTPGRGDLNGDGYVSLFEMYEYTSQSLTDYIGYGINSYHPRITGSAVDFIIFD